MFRRLVKSFQRSQDNSDQSHNRLHLEPLESRMMLTIIIDSDITTNTTWSDTTQEYCITAGVEVIDSATLTIAAGVEVSMNSFFIRMDVNGTVNVTDASFVGPNNHIRVEDGGTMNITGSTFDGERIEYLSGSMGAVNTTGFLDAQLQLFSDAVSINNGSFNNARPILTNPTFVPDFYDNSFANEATIEVQGDVFQNTSWQPINNVSRYELVSKINVNDTVELNVGPNLTVTTDGFANVIIQVEGSMTVTNSQFAGPDNEVLVKDGGSLDLFNAAVAGDHVEYESGSQGTIDSTDFTTAQLRVYSDNVTVNSGSFTNVNPVRTNPTFVPEFYDNTFAPGSTIEVEGDVNQNTSWQAITNLSRYRIFNSVKVLDSVELTVGANLIITSQDLNDVITVDGTLDVTDTDFVGPDNEIRVKVGGTFNLTGGMVAGESIQYDAGSQGMVDSVHFDTAQLRVFSEDVSVDGVNFTIANPVRANPTLVPEFYDNSFATDSTFEVEGTVNQNTSWQTKNNLTRYRIFDNVTVPNAIALNIGSGLTMTTQNFHRIIVNGTLNVENSEFVGDDNKVEVKSGGEANLQKVSFAGEFFEFEGGSSGIVNLTTFLVDVFVDGSSTAEINNNSFLSGTVTATGSSALVIDLTNNYWGTTNNSEIEARLIHQPDDSSLPLIDFSPRLTETPGNLTFQLLSAASNKIELRRFGGLFQIFDVNSNQVVESIAFDDLCHIEIIGGTAADNIVIDFSFGGFFSVFDGMTIAGGSGGSDKLTVVGTDNTNLDWMPDATATTASGAAQFTKGAELLDVNFTGIESYQISEIDRFTFEPQRANNFLKLDPKTIAGNDGMMISGTTNSFPVLPTRLIDVEKIVVDTSRVGNSDDTVTIARHAIRPDGLRDLDIKTGGGNDLVSLKDPDLALAVLGGAFRAIMGAGNDTIEVNANADLTVNDSVVTASGNSTINLTSAEVASLGGGSGNNILNATGFTGDVSLFGRRGNDTLRGGPGNDTIVGGGGNDTAFGNGGDDSIQLGQGADVAHGGNGIDNIQGGNGPDQIFGDGGNDALNGNDGNDIVDGGIGSDTIRGSGGQDILLGRAGNDRLFGNDGPDFMFGEAGNDELKAGDGGNLMSGGDGTDELWSDGTARNSYDGNAGADVLHFSSDVNGNCQYVEDPIDTLVSESLWLTDGVKISAQLFLDRAEDALLTLDQNSISRPSQ